jgi:hypothetical protein
MLVLPEGVEIPKASDELDPDDPDDAKLIELKEKNKKKRIVTWCVRWIPVLLLVTWRFSWFGRVRVWFIRMDIHPPPGIS